MKLKELGEFGFIESVSQKFSSLCSSDICGIGDDCAVFSGGEKEDFVVSTDLLLEDVHFLLDKTSFYELGKKSLAVNLSDLAAMGATPFASFLSLGAPPSISGEDLTSFMDGYRELSADFQIPLLGGDTSSSADKLVVNVCVIGKVAKGKAKLRSAGQLGDLVCVTGNLGNSAGGLQVLLQHLEIDDKSKFLVEAHHNVKPRVAEGIFLGQRDCVHAMMDISDGLASDLKHILKASNLGSEICLEDLPISAELSQVCTEQNWSALDLALAGGEDYELLFTVAKNEVSKLQDEYTKEFGKSFYVVGELGESPNKIVWRKKGEIAELQLKGFDHFNKGK